MALYKYIAAIPGEASREMVIEALRIYNEACRKAEDDE